MLCETITPTLERENLTQRRRHRGQLAYLSGQSAEDQIARDYERRGHSVAHRRWRCAVGEIDLIVRDADAVIFVEVKKSRDFGRAAESLSAVQIRRIRASAECFLMQETRGSLTECRFDVALLNAQGAVHIIENAFCEF